MAAVVGRPEDLPQHDVLLFGHKKKRQDNLETFMHVILARCLLQSDRQMLPQRVQVSPLRLIVECTQLRIEKLGKLEDRPRRCGYVGISGHFKNSHQGRQRVIHPEGDDGVASRRAGGFVGVLRGFADHFQYSLRALTDDLSALLVERAEAPEHLAMPFRRGARESGPQRLVSDHPMRRIKSRHEDVVGGPVFRLGEELEGCLQPCVHDSLDYPVS